MCIFVGFIFSVSEALCSIVQVGKALFVYFELLFQADPVKNTDLFLNTILDSLAYHRCTAHCSTWMMRWKLRAVVSECLLLVRNCFPFQC